MAEPFERRASALGRVLRRVIRGSDMPTRKAAAVLVDAWEAVAGAELAGRTNVAGYSRGVVTVEVDRSELLMELGGFRKGELVRKLSAAANRYTIRDIRFRLRPEPRTGDT